MRLSMDRTEQKQTTQPPPPASVRPLAARQQQQPPSETRLVRPRGCGVLCASIQSCPVLFLRRAFGPYGCTYPSVYLPPAPLPIHQQSSKHQQRNFVGEPGWLRVGRASSPAEQSLVSVSGPVVALSGDAGRPPARLIGREAGAPFPACWAAARPPPSNHPPGRRGKKRAFSFGCVDVRVSGRYIVYMSIHTDITQWAFSIPPTARQLLLLWYNIRGGGEEKRRRSKGKGVVWSYTPPHLEESGNEGGLGISAVSHAMPSLPKASHPQ